MDQWKLFMLGETDPNPERWSNASGRALVVARSLFEALSLSETENCAVEVPLDKPMVLLRVDAANA